MSTTRKNMASSVLSSTKAQASAAIDAAHAKIMKTLPERAAKLVGGGDLGSSDPRGLGTAIWSFLNPDLPPLLAPIPGICRLIAFLIIAPVIFACLTDFAGYAIFRTLGFRRRRVRVLRSSKLGKKGDDEDDGVRNQNAAAAALSPPSGAGGSVRHGTESPASSFKAPLLTPGAYDADTLLRHRARSISGESAEAEEEWARTGGQFARVSTIMASQAAATASSPGERSIDPLISPPDSPRHAFARARNVGVEGALGYSDTEAEDSGAESGRNSPEIERKPWQKRGLSSSGFSFTPVSSGRTNEGEKEETGLGVTLSSSSSSKDD